jgi:hypothetical protein
MLRRLFAGTSIAALTLLAGQPSVAAAAAAGVGTTNGAWLAISVPYVSQFTPVRGLGSRVAAYACGPASAAMAVAYWTGGPAPLARAEYLMGGTALAGTGSEPWQVAQAIRSLAPTVAAGAATAAGPSAAISLLRNQLALGRPVIALVHPTWFATSINHFVVVTGFDAQRRIVRFDDPLAGSAVQEPEAAFLAAWASPLHGRPYTYVWTAGAAEGGASLGSTAVTMAADVPAPARPADLPSAVGAQVTVIPAGLRLHAAPGAASEVVAYLARGDSARVTAAQDGWVRLARPGRTTGWADAAYVRAN